MEAYNPAGRQFWLEAYGGRRYRVERRKHGAEPIEVEHLVVSVSGGTQPERLSLLTDGVDDGLFARVLWLWPDPIPFELGEETPGVAWAVEALDRSRELDLAPGNPAKPILMPLTPDARLLLNKFGKEMKVCLKQSGGLLRSSYGKARGHALRLSLVLEWLWYIAKPDMPLPPDSISAEAFAAAAELVSEYFLPMAARVFGDADASGAEHSAATLARWILKERPDKVHVRWLQREVRLSGLRSADQIKKAANVLVDADWLRAPVIGFGAQSKVAYAINPRLWGQ
jgi:putative DNA primase/helicase